MATILECVYLVPFGLDISVLTLSKVMARRLRRSISAYRNNTRAVRV